MKIIFFLILNLIIISIQKQQYPPIDIWEIPLENFFKNFTLNFSSSELGLQYNKLEDHKNCAKQNLTYYLFLIQTQLQLSSYLESIEYRSYFGICLPFFENLNEVHLIQMTKYYLWDLNNLTKSIIMDYDTPILNDENNKNNKKAFYTILFYLLSLLIFTIYVSFFPIDEKFESKNEMENIKKNLEQNLHDNLILNDNLNFDNENKDSHGDHSRNGRDDNMKHDQRGRGTASQVRRRADGIFLQKIISFVRLYISGTAQIPLPADFSRQGGAWRGIRRYSSRSSCRGLF